MVKIECKSCGKSFSFDDESGDVPGVCPFCGNNLDALPSANNTATFDDDSDTIDLSEEPNKAEGSDLPDMPFPKKPVLKDYMRDMWLAILASIVFIAYGIVMIVLWMPIKKGHPDLSVYIFLGVGIWIAVWLVRKYSRNVEKYDIACKDFEEYKRICAEEEEKQKAALDKAQALEEERLSKLPECPICKSKEHVQRIGNLERSVDTAIWGMASSSIGKQYWCTECNHRF